MSIRRSHQSYARIDPLNTIGPILDRRAPAESCCCCCCRCRRVRAIYWALGIFIWEAVWHITISMLRPAWEWNSTNVTIFAYLLQNFCRLVLIVMCFSAWRALRRGDNEKSLVELRSFLRALILLFGLEIMEIAIKAVEVHNVVCVTAPLEVR